MPSSDFTHRLMGANGDTLFLEDLEQIAHDPDLTDDQKRDQFRELGILDEALIDILLGL